ncbi:hypothetical protein LZ318_25485 [Saccharopolyspora indica]|uniref:hypothetical protein n=1 Tax=Saccharopolyspora indica TaxID=1229659 RepID=UPI0022EA6C80|nr:hypothetical protein [Saccharopolyspora indica]MDA3646561.1 hypothetical protein [Saccharopolyspora indica]
MTATSPPPTRNASRRRTHWAPVLGLVVLSPIAAEYLSGYHGQRLSDLPGLLLSIGIVGPLYGGIAVLLREVARRTGRGWPTILLLAAAFGLVQAGLIDQALVDRDSFSGSVYWQELPAYLPWAGIDVSQLLVFVGGHAMLSFGAPIAVVEACSGRRAREPWLGPGGMVVIVLAYLGGAAVILSDVLTAGPAPAGVLATVAAIVVVLVVVALRLPRVPERRTGTGRVPPVWLLGAGALLLFTVHVVARGPEPGPWAWPSIAVSVVVLAVAGVLLVHWSRQKGWTPRHELAVAAAPLLCTAGMAFAVPALVPGSDVDKYASNAVFLLAVICLLVWAARRTTRISGG